MFKTNATSQPTTLSEAVSGLMSWPMDKLKLLVKAMLTLISLLVQMPEIDVTSFIQEAKLSDYLRVVVKAIRAKMREKLPDEKRMQIRLITKGKNLLNKTYFEVFFRESPHLIEMLLRAVTGKKYLRVERVETEVDYRREDGSKGAILDLVAWDSDRAVYDTEAQIDEVKAPIGRAVHYVDTAGVHSLSEGQDYSENPEVWSIFICEKDPCGKGKLLYHEGYGCIPGTNRFLRNFAYLNCSYRKDATTDPDSGAPEGQEDMLLALIHDFIQIDPNDMVIKEFREHAVALKTPDERGDNELDKAIQDLCVEWGRETAEQARKEEREAAATEKRKLFAKLRRKNATEEDIRDLLDLTKEQYDEYMSTVVI